MSTTSTETATPSSAAAHAQRMTSTTTDMTASQQAGLRCIEALHRAGYDLREVAEATGRKRKGIAVRLVDGDIYLTELERIAELSGVHWFTLATGKPVPVRSA